ncbi:probable 4-coumarate--CoA ligase 3 [Lutzomyia longipalpis]|uniref:probable 4-coumarate--CoA ligase 3 n=1 Tax=Lutzomyia longipalpis TaxID=7200 RepID=UPI0024838568|nr:probable 4-coumarate--CoA ligase 3 [Lutzomyia longipalpis]
MVTKYDSLKKIWSGDDFYTPFFHSSVSAGYALLYHLNLNPEKVCQICVDDGTTRTNGEIYRASLQIACNLKKLGCSKGDVVGFVCRNSHNLTPAVLAALYLAAPPNALDTIFSKDEIVHMFSTVKPKFVFCDNEVVEKVEAALKEYGSSAPIYVIGQTVLNFPHINDLMHDKDDKNSKEDIRKLILHPPQVDKDSCAKIICSSGTTGFSKGVALSHECFLNLYHKPHLKALFSPNDKIFNFSTLYWQSGYISIIVGIFFGLTRLITKEPFSPERWVEIVTKYRVGLITTSTSQIAQLAKSGLLQNHTMPYVKHLTCQGGYLSTDLVKIMRSCIPNGIIRNIYGLSETGRIASKTENSPNFSVGKLAPGVQAKIINEAGEKLGVGEVGELCVKTKLEFMGYFNNPEATEAARDNDGWFLTGDLANFDENGHLIFRGRKKFIFKYNNFHVSPIELEEILIKHPEVFQVAVVGIPDPIYTELPAAVVVRRENSSVDEEEIMKFLEGKVSDYKKLRGGVYFVQELPTTPSGKIRISLVREMVIRFYQERQEKI